MRNVFTIKKPARPLPLIFDSPHSGHIYPDDFNYACRAEDLAKTEDKFVDELFAPVPDYGGTLLLAEFPRAYIDVNRCEYDIDDKLIEGGWPFGVFKPTARSDAGIGLIRRLVKPGKPLYDRTLSAEEIMSRIERYYRPYHETLKTLLDEAHYNFGQVYHINCHSMPSSSALPKQAIGLAGNKGKQVDFCLGDRGGTTCGHDFTHALRDFLRGLGYTVTINDPFKGVELIKRYAAPTRGRHSLQIEINKALYMDEQSCTKSENYNALARDIEKLIGFCADFTAAQLTDLAAD